MPLQLAREAITLVGLLAIGAFLPASWFAAPAIIYLVERVGQAIKEGWDPEAPTS